MSDLLLSLATDVARRSHVPYSGEPVGAALRLVDGRTTAAPRLENASFPLTIPAMLGAWALAAVAGSAPVAVAMTRALTPGERAFLDELGPGWTFPAPHCALRAEGPAGPPASFRLDGTGPLSIADGARLALDATQRAVVPASGFRVGAVVETADGQRIAGANVEHLPDWTRGLCAERVALVAARAAGLGSVERLYVACATAPGGTPCGGCRQVIAELAPDAEIVLWQGDAPPTVTTPGALLPGAFGGASLGR